MFDIDKILGKQINKKNNKKDKVFNNIKFSNIFNKKSVSNMFNNIINNNSKKPGASRLMQQRWGDFPLLKKQKMRNKYKDTDGDRIPDKYDCMPKNIMRQHRYNKVTRRLDRTIYENPEGMKIIKHDNSNPIPTIDDVSYILDNAPIGYNKADIELSSKKCYAKRQGDEEYYKDLLRTSGDKGYVDIIRRNDIEEEALSIEKNPAFYIKEQRNKKTPSIVITGDVTDKEMFGSLTKKYNKDDYDTFKYIMFHEIGHSLDDANNSYYNISDTDKKIAELKTEPSSEYAKQSYKKRGWIVGSREDVADSFAQHEGVVPPSKYKKGVSGFSQFNKLLDSQRKQIIDEHFLKFKNTPTGNEKDLLGASLEKQNEWKEMSNKEQDFERQNKVDTDGDTVPDEYDCQPLNPDE